MSLSMVLTGLNGALGLYSSVKGMLDSSKAATKSKELRRKAMAEEDGWYRRNYYENLMNSTASRAAIKRVENTLRRQNQQERARAVVMGATPEYSVARNGQSLRSMENVMTGLASMESDKKNSVDAMHRQNRNALINSELASLATDEKMATSAAANGLNLFQNALLGAEWGKEKHDK